MKKRIRIISLAVVCLMISLIAAGCSVKGNTYVYEKCELAGEFDLTESQQTTICALVDTLMKSSKYTFESDGSYGSYFWKQSGSKVYIGNIANFAVSADNYLGELKNGKFVVSYEYDNKTFNLIYKKAN